MHLSIFPTNATSGIAHASFCRRGGVSSTPFDHLNISYYTADTPANIDKNRQIIKDALGISHLVSAKQIHGNDVFCLTDSPTHDLEIADYDALITNLPHIGLMVQQADCQAVMLFDPVQRVIANIHSGWRGSVANIIAKTIRQMTGRYAVQPANLQAAISPSLGPCCAEFINYREELPAHFHPYQHTPNHFDFWTISRDQLIQAGLATANIHTAGICTRCSNDYFSYRKSHNTGRQASVIALAGERRQGKTQTSLQP